MMPCIVTYEFAKVLNKVYFERTRRKLYEDLHDRFQSLWEQAADDTPSEEDMLLRAFCAIELMHKRVLGCFVNMPTSVDTVGFDFKRSYEGLVELQDICKVALEDIVLYGAEDSLGGGKNQLRGSYGGVLLTSYVLAVGSLMKATKQLAHSLGRSRFSYAAYATAGRELASSLLELRVTPEIAVGIGLQLLETNTHNPVAV